MGAYISKATEAFAPAKDTKKVRVEDAADEASEGRSKQLGLWGQV
jgi:hypothetical protein